MRVLGFGPECCDGGVEGNADWRLETGRAQLCGLLIATGKTQRCETESR